VPFFLKEGQIIGLHKNQILLFGGPNGIRDLGQLKSAIAAPEMLYDYNAEEALSRGEEITLFDYASTYAAHISRGQAFLDGNKRTGIQAAILFLKVNSYRVEGDVQNLFEWMHKLDCSRESKAAFAIHLRNCSVREGGLTQWFREFFSS
jgi:death-on-curing protein